MASDARTGRVIPCLYLLHPLFAKAFLIRAYPPAASQGIGRLSLRKAIG